MAVQQQSQEMIQLQAIEHPVGLLRISTDKTDFKGKKVAFEETLKNHEEKLTGYFDQMEWKKNFFREVLSGGTDYENRPELMAVLELIKEGKCDAIVVMELQRLSRQGFVSQMIKKACEKYQVLIITLNPYKVYDVARSMNDSFLFDITSSMGEHERKVASARVKANKISMARQGLNSSGSVPYGYVRNPQTKKLEIETMIIKDDEGFKQEVESPKANIVRMIYQWYLDGDGQRTICDKLNAMNIKNNQGKMWVTNSIKYLLTCPTYKGTLVAHTYENFKGKMKIDEDQTVVKNGNHPAIIDLETWEKAQEKRNIKKERSGIQQRQNNDYTKKNVSILDGLVFCGCETCGRKSTIKWYANRKNHYIIKCTRFNTDGKTCTNGGCNIKDIEFLVFEDLLKEKEKIEEKITTFSSDDFGIRTEELENQRKLYQDSLNELELEMNVIYKMEMKYEMEKEIKQKEDKAKEMMIAESKLENDQKRISVQMKLNEVIKKIQTTPSAEKEIQLLNERLHIINELQTNQELTKNQVNDMLKQIILKVEYKRETPPNFKTMSNEEKEKYPAMIEVEYLK